jgi:hypothetical protein
MVGDFEYITPAKNPPPFFIPGRLYLAYGMWTEADGAKVLFSRDYLPMWRLREGQKPELVDPRDWISWVEQIYFWEDISDPWNSDRRRLEEEQRLESYGVYGVPRLVAVLPVLVKNPDVGTIKAAVERL